MIILSDHAKDKLAKELKKLGITEKVMMRILKNPDELLYDALTERFVALSWSHKTAVIYEKTGGNLTVVTAIYSSELRNMVSRRKGTGRWI